MEKFSDPAKKQACARSQNFSRSVRFHVQKILAFSSRSRLKIWRSKFKNSDLRSNSFLVYVDCSNFCKWVVFYFFIFLKKETSKICQETSKNEWQKRTANYSKNGVQFAFEFKFWRSKFKVRKMNAVREHKLLLAFIAQACKKVPKLSLL